MRRPPLTAVLHRADPPLSYAQERLWTVQKLDPSSPAYNVPFIVRLIGPLQRDALWRSVVALVSRHEALRTTFPIVGAAPVQRISSEPRFERREVDLETLPVGGREPEALRLAYSDAVTPFDLTEGPLIRVLLARLGERDHVFAVTQHHIICDGWSVAIMAQELAALYAGDAAGRPIVLPVPPVQYADFAIWQRAILRGDSLAGHVHYWRPQLANMPALDLPIDASNLAARMSKAAVGPMRLSARLTQAVHAFSRRERVTPFMTLLSALQILLGKLTGQTDLAVGVPISGRAAKEVESVIGFFVNTVVIRTDLSGHPSFLDVVKQVRRRVLEAHAHGDVPFQLLLNVLGGARRADRQLLFRVLFVLHEAAPTIGFAGLEVRPIPIVPPRARFDLTLSLVEHGGHFRGGLEYASDLFTANTIARITEGYEHLLNRLLWAPNHAIEDLSWSAEADGHRSTADRETSHPIASDR